MEKRQTQATKVPPRVWITIIIVVMVSLMAILSATYIISLPEGSTYADIALLLLIFGAIGAGTSLYALMQVRKRIQRAKIESPPITTTLECKACGIKSVREFQRGDYIFKEGEPCQKCKGKTLIAAIYREVKEKEREVFPF